MMMIDIDPACYTTPSASTYNAVIGDLYARGLIHKAQVIVEIDSVGAEGTPIYPPMTKEEMAVGGSSRRNVIFTQRPRFIDETFLQYAATGIQGGFMFQVAGLVQRNILRVQVSVSGGAYTTKTAAQIMEYAVNVASAVPSVWS